MHLIITKQHAIGTFHIDENILVFDDLRDDNLHAVLLLHKVEGTLGGFQVIGELGGLGYTVAKGIIIIRIEVARLLDFCLHL